MTNQPSRMTRRRPATPVGERGVTVKPFHGTPKNYPHRLSVDIDEATYAWLRACAYDNHVGAGTLARGLLYLASERPELVKEAVAVVEDNLRK